MASSDWTYHGTAFHSEDIGEAVAFVYEIECIPTGRKYIGQKLFTKAKTVQRNLKKRKTRVESDWENYWGSNTELQKDVEVLGPENFKRTILFLAFTKSEANYRELYEQMHHEVLLRPDFYNGFIGKRIGANGLQRLMKKGG